LIAAGPALGGGLAMTPDARYVAFVAEDASLVPGDTNNFPDVFVRDRLLGTTDRVNITPSGTQEISSSTWRINATVPKISADGRYVVFESITSNMTQTADVFVRDRATQTTQRADLGVPGLPTKCSGSAGDISDDGRSVSFLMDCAADGTVLLKEQRGVYVRDLDAGVTTRADIAEDGTVSNANPIYGLANQLSGDGRWVAFGSPATNLVAGDGNNSVDVFAVRVNEP
jgi:Tol biopolymer transport system component